MGGRAKLVRFAGTFDTYLQHSFMSCSTIYTFDFHSDPCDNTKCQKYATCVTRADYQAFCACPMCSTNYRPVCGGNGMSYASECWMRRAACQRKRDIKIVKQDACGKKTYFEIYLFL